MLFNFGSVAKTLTALAIVGLPLATGSKVSHVARDSNVQPSPIGNPVVFGAGTYPRAIKLADGNLLGAYTAFSNGNNIIKTTQSVDQGSSWKDLGSVTTGVGDIDNPFLLQLTNGRILCAFRNHSKDPATGAYTTFRITICFSDDNGATWKYLSQPATDPGPVNGNWEPFMRQSSRDPSNIQLYYSRENSGDDQDSLMRTSTDGGLTWSLASIISGAGITARDGMIGVAIAPGGSSSDLIAIFESKDTAPGGTGLFTVHSVTSGDDGATWGNRRLVYSATGSKNNAGAPQIVNVGGTLVASFMTDEDSSLHNWIEGANAKVITSSNGVDWASKVTVFDVQTNWPGLLVLDGAQFLVLGDHDGSKAQLMSI